MADFFINGLFDASCKTRWTDDAIKEALQYMISKTGQNTLPTYEEIRQFYGNYKLTNAMRRTGGPARWAKELGMEIKDSESRLGFNYEDYFIDEMVKSGHICTHVNILKDAYPYDVLVDNAVKVDVKVSRKFGNYGSSPYYTFNLEKKNQTCDVYACYCIEEDKDNNAYVSKFYTIPASVLSGKRQLSIGMGPGKYTEFMNNYEPIERMSAMASEYKYLVKQ